MSSHQGRDGPVSLGDNMFETYFGHFGQKCCTLEHHLAYTAEKPGPKLPPNHLEMVLGIKARQDHQALPEVKISQSWVGGSVGQTNQQMGGSAASK